MTIVTHPQSSILTYVTDSEGRRRAARVTSKQFIYDRTRDFNWHPVSTFTQRISPSGFRARISELERVGYQFERRYNETGRTTHLRLVGLPQVGVFRATA